MLAKSFVGSVTIGAKRLDQVAQNLAAVDIELDPGDPAALDKVSQLLPEYSGWMLERTAPTRIPSGKQAMPATLFPRPTLKVSS